MPAQVEEVLEVNEVHDGEVEEVGTTVKRERRPIDESTVGILYTTKEEANGNPVKYEDGTNVEKSWYVYKAAKITKNPDGTTLKEENTCFVWARNPIEALGHLAANKGYEAELADPRRRGASPKKPQPYLIAVWPMILMQAKATGDEAVPKSFVTGILEAFSPEVCLEAFGPEFMSYA